MTATRTKFAGVLLVAVVMLTAGLGLRDPWPADEPRFALVAQEMVASGDWLFPTVGGDLYPDKPPLFFWAVASLHAAGLPVRVALLVPAAFAGLLTLLLVFDLARRLWSPRVGVAAAALLAFSVQFIVQARSGQIDGFLLGVTTLSLYGLLRHLLQGPAWRWWTVGWAAAGLGVITKGVGFLPLLIIVPWLFLPRAPMDGRWRWLLGPLAFAAAIGAWLGPMVLAAAGDPALAAYRDEILFRQTAVRYADTWTHLRPVWYYLVEVIPILWLPGALLVPWLLPRWRDAWRARDPRVLLPLGWLLLVLVFFSVSPGKRDVYLLPALPAFVLASAPFVESLLRRTGVQRMLLTVLAGAAMVALWVAISPGLDGLTARFGYDPRGWLAALAAGLMAAAVAGRGGRAVHAWLVATVVVVFTWGWAVAPQLDGIRSGRDFMATVEARVPADGALGLVAWKEQFLLQSRRPIVHFGFRNPDPAEEFARALEWARGDPKRRILLPASTPGFEPTLAEWVGSRHREDWWLSRAPPSP